MPGPGGSDGEQFSASTLREYSLGNLNADHSDVHKHAGLVTDPDVARMLSWMASVHDPSFSEAMPASFWETNFAERILKQYGTAAATEALQSGNTQILDYITGLPNWSGDASAVKLMLWLSDWLTRTAPITLVSGHMGTGKTDFSLLLAELWSELMRDEFDRVTVVTNIESCTDADINTTSMQRVVDVAERSDGEAVHVVIDEASSHFSGYSSDRGDVEEQLRRFMRLTRKNNCALTLIGHGDAGADIHPDACRLAQAVLKESKKKATVFEGIEVGSGREYSEEVKSLVGIPQTSWEYNTREESTWQWDLEDSEGIEVAPMPDGEVSQCRGVKSNGDRCGTTHALDDRGFCEHHADQAGDRGA